MNNRHITGVFVSRHSPTTTVGQLRQHIKSELRCECQPQKLKARFNTYSSFFIPADRKLRSALLDSQMWPVGSLIKPFYSK